MRHRMLYSVLIKCQNNTAMVFMVISSPVFQSVYKIIFNLFNQKYNVFFSQNKSARSIPNIKVFIILYGRIPTKWIQRISCIFDATTSDSGVMACDLTIYIGRQFIIHSSRRRYNNGNIVSLHLTEMRFFDETFFSSWIWI